MRNSVARQQARSLPGGGRVAFSQRARWPARSATTCSNSSSALRRRGTRPPAGCNASSATATAGSPRRPRGPCSTANTVSSGAAACWARTNQARTSRSATAAHPRASFASEKSTPTTRRFRRARTIPSAQITLGDAWIDDVNSPAIQPARRRRSEEPARVVREAEDAARRLRVSLARSKSGTTPTRPSPAHGSAIFFHIRRGVDPPQRRLHHHGRRKPDQPDPLAPR